MQSTTAIDCKVTRQTDKVNDKYIATIQKKKNKYYIEMDNNTWR